MKIVQILHVLQTTLLFSPYISLQAKLTATMLLRSMSLHTNKLKCLAYYFLMTDMVIKCINILSKYDKLISILTLLAPLSLKELQDSQHKWSEDMSKIEKTSENLRARLDTIRTVQAAIVKLILRFR